jgi:hypothetical protein
MTSTRENRLSRCICRRLWSTRASQAQQKLRITRDRTKQSAGHPLDASLWITLCINPENPCPRLGCSHKKAPTHRWGQEHHWRTVRSPLVFPKTGESIILFPPLADKAGRLLRSPKNWPYFTTFLYNGQRIFNNIIDLRQDPMRIIKW